MPEKRIRVWVQEFKDRKNLMLQWTDPDTNRVKSKSAGTADRGEAEARRTDLESDLNNGRYQDAGRITWEQFRELFEEHYLPNVRPGTRKKYAEVFSLFEQAVRPGRLSSVKEATLGAFLSFMRKREVRGRVGMMPSTMRVYLQLLHTALAWAATEKKIIPAVPAFPSVKVTRKRPQPVPAEAFEKLLDKAPSPAWKALLLTCWLAGLRVSEAYALEWEESDQAPWLDLPRRRVWIPGDFAKAGEDQWVPVDPELQPVLEALPRAGRRVFDLRARDGHRLALSTVSDYVARLAKRAGVKMTMHSLRKGFGCRYAGRVPAQVLQKLMRHSDIRTTMGYYANVDAAVEEAVFGAKANTSSNSGRPAVMNERPQHGANVDSDRTSDDRA